MLKLQCPSCGGQLEIPENMSVAHCIYCGTKILLSETASAQEQQNLRRYVELCKIALEAKNYEDSLKYCNSILEIDPNNVEAWINKAISAFWHSTVENKRYDEAMEYLSKAENIEPKNQSIYAMRNKLKEAQSNWLIKLANEAFESGIKFHDSDYRKNYALEAVDNFVQAWRLGIDTDENFIRYIGRIVSSFYSVGWSELINRIERISYKLLKKAEAERSLPQYREELRNQEALVKKLKRERNIFTGFKINDAEAHMEFIKEQISKFEEALCFNEAEIAEVKSLLLRTED